MNVFQGPSAEQKPEWLKKKGLPNDTASWELFSCPKGSGKRRGGKIKGQEITLTAEKGGTGNDIETWWMWNWGPSAFRKTLTCVHKQADQKVGLGV